jgi:hypothetical protein
MEPTKQKLAIDGGPRVKTTPNIHMYPGGLEIGEEEKKAVMQVLDDKYYSGIMVRLTWNQE